MRLVITGDKSRYQFFRKIVSYKNDIQERFFTEKLSDRDIYLVSNKQEVNECTYYSDKIPLNTILFFPKEYGNSLNDYKSTDKIIVFDEFPYATDGGIRNLEKIKSLGKYNQLQVVIFKNNRVGLENDISTDEMAIYEAKEIYSKMDVPVYTYTIDERADFLLWTSFQQEDYVKRLYQLLIKKLNDNIATFDSLYEFIFEESGMASLIDIDILTDFFKFESNMKGKNVWDVYYKRSFNHYWKDDSRIDIFYIGLYKSIISEFCEWDLEYDIKNLKELVRKKYQYEFNMFKPLIFSGEKNIYDEFLNIHQEQILNFKLRIKDFFYEKLRNILKQRIIYYAERMEELIK